VRRSTLLLVVALTLAGCGGDETSQPEAENGVAELTNVLDLRSDFEAHAGRIRVVILLSPT
jgi:ABC-type glycerol-3-phosphate transport system substrate-binding protein